MHRMRAKGRKALLSAIALASAAALTAISVALPATAREKPPSSDPLPTVVLVHGAFADASGWNDVSTRLQKRGYTVIAPANPLRGVTSDSDYLKTVLATLPGPIVLVGHSYGGAVITNAATGNPNVKSLVYIASYALDANETLVAANALGGGHNDFAEHLVIRPFGAGPTDADAYIDPTFFHDLFAGDLPMNQTAVMAASQRPAALATLLTPSGTPAWQTTPSWYLVAADDHTIPPEAQRAMAARAGSTTIEVDSSHVAMISNPAVVTQLVVEAAQK